MSDAESKVCPSMDEVELWEMSSIGAPWVRGAGINLKTDVALTEEQYRRWGICERTLYVPNWFWSLDEDVIGNIGNLAESILDGVDHIDRYETMPNSWKY